MWYKFNYEYANKQGNLRTGSCVFQGQEHEARHKCIDMLRRTYPQGASIRTTQQWEPVQMDIEDVQKPKGPK